MNYASTKQSLPCCTRRIAEGTFETFSQLHVNIAVAAAGAVALVIAVGGVYD